MVTLRNSISELTHWLRAQWVTEVPEDLAICEFECPASQCSWDDWAQCVHRVSNTREQLVRLGQSVGDSNHRHVA